jgi:hypothetical protein
MFRSIPRRGRFSSITPWIAPSLALALFPAVASAQIGTVLRGQRIDALDAVLPEDAYFGNTLTRVGDLDGDGITELAVGAPHVVETFFEPNTEAGSVWILFLAADGSVRATQEIGRGKGGFQTALPDGAVFGIGLQAVGDLDGDGLSELAVLSDEPNPANPHGRPIGVHLWILFLDSAGKVRQHAEITDTDPAFVPPINPRYLFQIAGAPGDTDGDGVPDLALASNQRGDAGAFWILRLNADGTAKSTLRIGPTSVPIADGDGFGESLTRLGDIDRDGNSEVAVSAVGADDRRGSLWILSMRPDQSVLRSVELDRDDFATTQVKAWDSAAIGDLDGDRIPELAVSLPDYFAGQPLNDIGGLMVTFLASDGSVRKREIITRGEGGFALPLPQGTGFGRAVEFLGDLDRDGNPEIATGGQYYGDDHGTVWILSLRASPMRNGSGVNTVALREKSEPAIGTIWRAALDCRGQAPGFALLGFYRDADLGVATPAGEVLVGGDPLVVFRTAHTGNQVRFDVLIPPSVSLVNLQLHAQGLCTGAPGPRLSNALDMLVGR